MPIDRVLDKGGTSISSAVSYVYQIVEVPAAGGVVTRQLDTGGMPHLWFYALQANGAAVTMTPEFAVANQASGVDTVPIYLSLTTPIALIVGVPVIYSIRAPVRSIRLTFQAAGPGGDVRYVMSCGV